MKRQSSKRGQTLTEYIIILVVVAIAAIGVVTVFGDRIKALFNASTEELGGTPAANTSTDLSTYGN